MIIDIILNLKKNLQIPYEATLNKKETNLI